MPSVPGEAVKPELSPDVSWLRFEQSGITGLFPSHTVDAGGNYRCEICDRWLPSRARRCESCKQG